MFFFYWLIAIMPLEYHPFWGRDLIGTFTVVKLFGLLCFLIALGRIASGTAQPRLLQSSQARWFLAFALIQCSSYFVQGGNLANTISAYSHVISTVSLFVVVPTLVDSGARFYRSLLVMVGAVGFTSLYTIREQQKYGGIAGFRPGGMLDDSNQYALVVTLWIPVAFVWAFSQRPLWERAVCFGALITSVVGVTFAASRGGFLGLIASFLFLIAHSKHRIRSFVWLAALLVPLTIFHSGSVWHRFTNPEHRDQIAEHARLVTWKAGLRMMEQHPLTGIGILNFKSVVEQYEDPGERVIHIAHNTYIEVGAELGIPALVIFLGILIWSFISLEKVRVRARDAGMAHFAKIMVALQAGLLSYAISAFFISAWWQKLVWSLIFFTMCSHRLGMRIPLRSHQTTAHASPNVKPGLVCSGA